MIFILIGYIWALYYFWYYYSIISPGSINCSKKVLDSQELKEGSRLNFLYFNKRSFPKLKIIAYEAIIYFVGNLVFTIVTLLLYFNSTDLAVIVIFFFVYFFLYAGSGAITKLLLNYVGKEKK